LTNEAGGLGLSCTEAGLLLAGTPLLQKSEAGFAPRSMAEIEGLVQAAYGKDMKATDLLPGINSVAIALNRGETAHAMTVAVLMRLPELDWTAAARLAHAENRVKKYDPDEPRDPDGPPAVLPTAKVRTISASTKKHSIRTRSVRLPFLQ
jgi:hypothetical protein